MATKRKKPAAQYLTLREALRELDLDDTDAARQRLRRAIIGREKRLKKPIAIRKGDGPRPRLYVTMPQLKRYMPELFDRRDAMLVRLEGEFETINNKLGWSWERDKALGAKLDALLSLLTDMAPWLDLLVDATNKQGVGDGEAERPKSDFQDRCIRIRAGLGVEMDVGALAPPPEAEPGTSNARIAHPPRDGRGRRRD